MLPNALERTEVKINDKKMDCDSYVVHRSSVESNKLEITIYAESQEPYKVIVEVSAPNPDNIVSALEKEIYPKRTHKELIERQIRVDNNSDILVDYIDIDEIIDTFRKNSNITINVRALDK